MQGIITHLKNHQIAQNSHDSQGRDNSNGQQRNLNDKVLKKEKYCA